MADDFSTTEVYEEPTLPALLEMRASIVNNVVATRTVTDAELNLLERTDGLVRDLYRIKMLGVEPEKKK